MAARGAPCKAYSRARRADAFARVPPLRSELHPLGLPKLKPRHQRLVNDANLMAKRMAMLARAQVRVGGWISIENPEHSLLWQTPAYLRLRNLPGCRLVCGDQCCLGGRWQQPTGWLTNAGWLAAVVEHRCPGCPAHPKHPLMRGFLRHPETNEMVWATSLAAAYPPGLCQALAEAYHQHAGEPQTQARGPSEPRKQRSPNFKPRYHRQLRGPGSNLQSGEMRRACASYVAPNGLHGPGAKSHSSHMCLCWHSLNHTACTNRVQAGTSPILLPIPSN